MKQMTRRHFLPSTHDDQMQSDYEVGISNIQYGFNLVAGGAITTEGWF
jgi:hypothetical protein